jgi:hypothetical protein
VSGNHRYWNARRVLLHPFDQLQAITVGQLHVGQAQIEALGLEQSLRVRDTVRRSRIKVHALQRDREQLAKIRLVVNY